MTAIATSPAGSGPAVAPAPTHAAPAPWAVDASVWRDHPLGRGEFVAAVFSGSAAAIGEAAGQDTWATPLKFALPDPRLSESDDFASTLGAVLPRWPHGEPAPADGVCFVFSDDRHPLLASLAARGGREHEHFVVLTRPPSRPAPEARFDDAIRGLLSRTGDGPIVVLGYGDQGARLCRRLRAVAPAVAHRAIVVDASPQRRRLAQEAGFATADQSSPPDSAAGVIYTPLERFDGLFSILETLEQRGAAVLRDPHSGRPYFVQRGSCLLNPAAARALEVADGRLRARTHGLAIEAAVVRDDLRLLGGREVRHLHGMERIALREPTDGADLGRPSPADRLSPATFVRSERAYIGLFGADSISAAATAPLGCLAGREFCSQFWPRAVDRIFPSSNWRTLGRTAFERRLSRYASSRTVGTSLQSWAQQVLIGVAAAHGAGAGDGAIVEIGCATGGTTALMGCATAAARADGRLAQIYTIDPDPAMAPINRFVAEQEGYADRLHQVVATSDEANGTLAHLRGRCGVVLIDGDHSEAGVARDFENYAELTAPGGILLFHDVSARDLGVLNVVAARVIPDPRFRLVCLVDTMAVFERVG